MSELITGTLLFRDLKQIKKDKRLFLLIGQLWVPSQTGVDPEHLYKLVGSTYVVKEPELNESMGLQILLNGGIDVSHETKKKHPSQIVSLLHTDSP